MTFKIDTKENYTVLTPDSTVLDENLTEAISKKWTELLGNGAENLIVNLSSCNEASENIMNALAAMHEEFYTENHSLVFTNLQQSIKAALQNHEYYHAINITPTMIEAIDIVSMEVLERDLLGEEGEELE